MSSINNTVIGESAKQTVQVGGGASSMAEARQETDGAVAAARAEMAEGRAALATKYGATVQFYPTYGKATGAIVTQSHFAAQAEARKIIKKVAADEPGLGLRPEKLAAARTEVRGSRMAGYYEVTSTEEFDEDAWAAVQISLRSAGFELVRAAEEMVEAEWMWAVPAGDPRIGAMLAALWRAGVGPVAVIDRAHGFDLMPAARRGGRSIDGGPPRPVY